VQRQCSLGTTAKIREIQPVGNGVAGPAADGSLTPLSGLFYAGFNAGICPAGGAHNKSGSGNYSVAFDVDA
jgi:hypothetical protein